MSDCKCDDEVRPGSAHASALGAASKVLSGRLTVGLARDLSTYCSTNSCSQSTALRIALAKLAASSDDPDAQLAAVREALALEPDAGRAEINTALDAVFAIVGDPSAEEIDPNAAAADAPPVPPLAASKPTTIHLTSAQLAARQARPKPAPPQPTALSRAFPTTPAEQKKWVAARAAQRAKRR